MEVKVGQVWRNKVNGSPRVIKDVENDSVKTSTLDGFEHIWHISQLNGYFELVTMENIKPGEWVESIVNVPDGNDTRKGTKLKVSWEEGQNIQFYNRTGSYYKPHFKPCLPPKEENTNSEIMQKPPIGIMPRNLWKERFDEIIQYEIKARIDNINGAINRFQRANKAVPIEWIEEYNELVNRNDD